MTELTKKYISSHNDELAIQFLIMYSNDPTISTEEYEEIISEHFLKYIQDKRLFDIQLPILYRIFTKYQEMNGNEVLNNQNIVDFLFKCLDKYGRQASVLFTNVDFRFLQHNCLDSLLTKYSKIFDFSYINFAFLKSLYEQQNEIIRKEIENSKKIDEFQNQMKQEFEKIKSDHKKDLESQKQTEYENIKNIKNEMSKMKIELEQQLTKQKDKYEKDIITLKKEIKEQISKQIDEKIKQGNTLTFEYDGNIEHCFKGIINHLTEVCGGNVHYKGVVNVSSLTGDNSKDVIVLNDMNSYFVSKGSNIQNQWLKYDFKNKKIKPTYYAIRSRPDGEAGHYNPQTWVIEGSNSDRDDDWTILDSQNNVNYLDGQSLSHVFTIKQSLNEYYRYVRFRQTGKNTGNDYDIRFSALEFFGSILK